MSICLSNRQSLFFATFVVGSLLFLTQAKAQNQCSQVFKVSGSALPADIAELDMLFSPEKDKVQVLYKEDNSYKLDEWNLLE